MKDRPVAELKWLRPLLAVLFFPGIAAPLNAVELKSPDGQISAQIEVNAAGDLVYSVSRAGRPVVSPSRMGVTVDEADLGSGVVLQKPLLAGTSVPLTDPEGKPTGQVEARTLSLPVQNEKSSQSFTVEARAANDGFAWRLVVPGSGERRVQGEATSWNLPEESRVWFAERNSPYKLKSYAGEFRAAPLRELSTVSKQGPVQCPPLLAELPGGSGFAMITEAALADYSGMRLRATPPAGLSADFTEGEKGFLLSGPIVTPWRVVLLVPDLNRLVNSRFLASLNPPPDPALFADRSYIKPGRCAWRWWSQNTGTPEQEQAVVKAAAELGFEYTLIDDGWKRWPEAWQTMRKIVEAGRAQHVGIFIWEDSNAVRNPKDDYAALRAFLDAAREAGVAGVKMDFFNSEAKESVDFQRTIFRMAAERRLMVVLHGVQKPTGEERTFPNAITREGIRGLELNKMREGPIPPRHNAALPFARYPAGPGDYTPLGYSKPGKTTWSHQLATVVLTDSPLLVIAEDPGKLLRQEATRPALDVLKAIPATWDETRVLPESRVGELAALARRKGDDWFLAFLSGNEPVSLGKPDFSFLGDAEYDFVLLSSPEPQAFARREWTGRFSSLSLPGELPAGDAVVVWVRKHK